MTAENGTDRPHVGKYNGHIELELQVDLQERLNGMVPSVAKEHLLATRPHFRYWHLAMQRSHRDSMSYPLLSSRRLFDIAANIELSPPNAMQHRTVLTFACKASKDDTCRRPA